MQVPVGVVQVLSPALAVEAGQVEDKVATPEGPQEARAPVALHSLQLGARPVSTYRYG